METAAELRRDRVASLDPHPPPPAAADLLAAGTAVGRPPDRGRPGRQPRGLTLLPQDDVLARPHGSATLLAEDAPTLGGGAPLVEFVGGTPLLELPAWGPPGVKLLAKAEHLNPGGSVKDRAAWWIVAEAERLRGLGPGKTLLDSSSGNTGIAYAMLGAARGFAVEICIPRNANPQRKRVLRAYGATLVETDPLEGADGAARVAQGRAEADPERFVFADQYNNPANARAHYESTGPEVWHQTGGRITHWVAGLGTGGTFTGTARRLRELNPAIRRVAVQPEGPLHGLEGMKHYGSSVIPRVYDPAVADEVLAVATEEAQRTAIRLAREAGLLVGTSAGANVAAALRVAEGLEDGVVVTVLCDGGERYLAEEFWERA